MFRRIAAYILFVLGFITILFFKKYSGTIIPYPFLFWLLGLAMFGIGWYLLRVTPTVKESKDRERLNKLIAELKSTGEKITVDLTKCEIKTNNYTEEKERYGAGNELTTFNIERDIHAFNALGGDSINNTKLVQVYQSVLVFKNEHNGQTETFISRVIPKEKTTLQFSFGNKKETTLYVDPNDRRRYYFDLDFLND